MHDTKLIILLRTFEEREIKALDKFIQSPYFNNSKTISHLWIYLKKYAPIFDAPQLVKEKIFKKIFPKLSYDDKKLRQLRSRLFKLVEEFLAIEQFKKERFLVQKKLATAYYEKGIYNWFEDNYRELIQDIEKKSIQNEDEYLASIQLHHELFFNQRSTKHTPNPPDLLKCTEQLENFYWLGKLKYACEWNSRRLITREKIPVEMINLKIPKKFTVQKYPLIYLYQKIYQLYKQPIQKNEILLENTIKFFYKLQNCIDVEKQTPILMYLLNYGIRAFKIDEIKYSQKLFSIYKIGISSKALFWKQLIGENSFINIVYVGCLAKDYNWVSNFINNYQQHLTFETRQETISYCLSILHFFKANYVEAFYQLENLKTSNLIKEMSRRALQIRTCFECFLLDDNFYSILLGKSENFRKFLNRNENINDEKKIAFHKLNESIKTMGNLIYKNGKRKSFLNPF